MHASEEIIDALFLELMKGFTLNNLGEIFCNFVNLISAVMCKEGGGGG
jgi:hypothetical protein